MDTSAQAHDDLFRRGVDRWGRIIFDTAQEVVKKERGKNLTTPTAGVGPFGALTSGDWTSARSGALYQPGSGTFSRTASAGTKSQQVELEGRNNDFLASASSSNTRTTSPRVTPTKSSFEVGSTASPKQNSMTEIQRIDAKPLPVTSQDVAKALLGRLRFSTQWGLVKPRGKPLRKVFSPSRFEQQS